MTKSNKEKIYLADGSLLGSKQSHFEKPESIIPSGDIPDAETYPIKKEFSRKVQKEFR